MHHVTSATSHGSVIAIHAPIPYAAIIPMTRTLFITGLKTSRHPVQSATPRSIKAHMISTCQMVMPALCVRDEGPLREHGVRWAAPPEPARVVERPTRIVRSFLTAPPPANTNSGM
jgi:hypothetical protein